MIGQLAALTQLNAAPRITFRGEAFANGAAVTYPNFRTGTLALRLNANTAASAVALTTGHTRFASPFINAAPASRRLMWTRSLTVGDTDTTTTGVNHVLLYDNARIKVATPVALGADPFTFTSGSNSVVVADTATTKVVGDVVNIAGATLAHGVTMSGGYTVTAVSTDSYTVYSADAATGTGTGGGSDCTHALSSVKVKYSGTANTTVVLPAQSPAPGEVAFGNFWTRETQTSVVLRAGLPSGSRERQIRSNTNAQIHFDSPAGWAEANITVASSVWCAFSGILAPTL